MADNWKPGDLALCVNVDHLYRKGVRGTAGQFLKKGRIYTVEALTLTPKARLPALVLQELTHGNRCAGAERFRKIHPHTPDAEDAETIKLLNQPQYIGA